MRTLALCGNSVALSSIAASLQARVGMRVLPADQLGTVQPEVVVFDLRAGHLDSLTANWQAKPHLLLIGLDLAEGGALVISGQASRALTVEDLVQFIGSQSRDGEVAVQSGVSS